MFSNIYKGNFHRNVKEFEGELFVDIAEPTTFDVIHKESHTTFVLQWAIVVKQNCSGKCHKEYCRSSVSIFPKSDSQCR